MSINYYFISSPLHLLFSANLAIQNQGERNIAILVSHVSSQATRMEEQLKSGQSVFTECLSFESGKLKGKVAERKRRLKLVADFVRENPPTGIYTGTDRRVEFQYAMYLARKLSPNVKGIYLDEGMATYLGHRYINRISHKWLDPLLKKISYGLWWDSPLIIGYSKWIDEVYAAFPDSVHPLLRSKKVNAMEQSHFQTQTFKEFAQNLVNSSSLDFERLAQAKVLILLTLESFYDDPDAHLAQIIEQARNVMSLEQIAIKAHPRSKAVVHYQKLYPEALFVDNQVGLELLLPHLNPKTVFIGDISSTLFTIKWFNPGANLAAVELKQKSYTESIEKIKIFYQTIGVTSLEHTELGRLFES